MHYTLTRKTHPYVPRLEGYGPGATIPWPNISSLAVGYRRRPDCPGNLYLPGKFADGGRWEIISTWQTGWMAIRSLITNEIHASVPPGTLSPIYYHGSPRNDLTELRSGSYVTPDLDTAILMGRFYEDTGRTWTDHDLEAPHQFGTVPRFRRVPTGKPTIYFVSPPSEHLDLLGNPYEHQLLRDTPAATVV